MREQLGPSSSSLQSSIACTQFFTTLFTTLPPLTVRVMTRGKEHRIKSPDKGFIKRYQSKHKTEEGRFRENQDTHNAPLQDPSARFLSKPIPLIPPFLSFSLPHFLPSSFLLFSSLTFSPHTIPPSNRLPQKSSFVTYSTPLPPLSPPFIQPLYPIIRIISQPPTTVFI